MTRVFPHSPEAEASILGGVILRNALLAELDLEVESFYDNRHKVVFAAMRNLEAAERPIDVVTLENEIEKTGKLDALGGIAFLGELTLRVPTVDNVHAYAEIVRDKAFARQLMLAASEITERGYEQDLDVREYLDAAEAKILAATARRGNVGTATNVGTLAKQRLRELDEIMAARARGENVVTGAPTGIAELDRRLGGWQFGVVNVLAARPAMGKTATARGSAEATAAVELGVHVFTLEDSKMAYTDRNLSKQTGIPATKIRAGDVVWADTSKLVYGAANLGRYDRWIVDDRGGLTAQEIIRSVRRERRRLRTRLVVVDYLQLVRRNPRADENAALDEIMTAFATAAKEPGEGGELIAWLVLSQLNRKVEERTDKRPQLADLRGSGAIEERVKVAVAQYRGAYYSDTPIRDVDYDCFCTPGTPLPACPHRPSAEEFDRMAQLILLKNTNGMTGRVFATWSGPTMEIW